MRTKALFLAAAIVAAGLTSSLAQSNVYSLNVVGYVNVTIPAVTNGGGFAILGNPLTLANVSNNNITNVLNPETVPFAYGTKVYTFNPANGQYTISTFSAPDPFNDRPTNYWDQIPTIAPGTGFWVKNVSNAPVTVTFVGEVVQGNQTNAIPAGLSLRSSIVPQAGQLDTVLGYPATENATKVYQYRAAGSGGYIICNYYSADPFNDHPDPYWDTTPVLNVGEGFWTREFTATNWIRSFNVQ